MDDSEAVSLEQIRGFLAGSGEVRFTGLRRAEVYSWVERNIDVCGAGSGTVQTLGPRRVYPPSEPTTQHRAFHARALGFCSPPSNEKPTETLAATGTASPLWIGTGRASMIASSRFSPVLKKIGADNGSHQASTQTSFERLLAVSTGAHQTSRAK